MPALPARGLDEEEILAIDRAGDVANCGVTEYRFDPAAGKDGGLVLAAYNVTAPMEEDDTRFAGQTAWRRAQLRPAMVARATAGAPSPRRAAIFAADPARAAARSSGMPMPFSALVTWITG